MNVASRACLLLIALSVAGCASMSEDGSATTSSAAPAGSSLQSIEGLQDAQALQEAIDALSAQDAEAAALLRGIIGFGGGTLDVRPQALPHFSMVVSSRTPDRSPYVFVDVDVTTRRGSEDPADFVLGHESEAGRRIPVAFSDTAHEPRPGTKLKLRVKAGDGNRARVDWFDGDDWVEYVDDRSAGPFNRSDPLQSVERLSNYAYINALIQVGGARFIVRLQETN